MPKLKWVQGLVSGMDQATDPSMVANNEAQLLKNVTLHSPGNWTSRKGIKKIGNTISTTEKPEGLFTYNKQDNEYKLGVVVDRDLYFYNESTSSFGTAVDTDVWPVDTRVNSVNFLDRIYLGSVDGSTPLGYSTGGSVTNVSPTISGGQLAVFKNMLAVAGNSIDPKLVFYTDPYTDRFHRVDTTVDTVNGQVITVDDEVLSPDMQGSTVYNTTQNEFALFDTYIDTQTLEVVGDITNWASTDTVYILNNVFRLDDNSTALVAYNESFISFDEESIYLWDPTQQPNGWSQKITNGPGCVSQAVIQVVNGKYIVWANRESIWLMTSQNGIIDVAAKIRNKYTQQGVLDLIDRTNIDDWVSWKDDTEELYYLSVGTLNTKDGALASGIQNCVIVVDLKKGAVFIENYNTKPYNSTIFTNENGDRQVYVGLSDSSTIYSTSGTLTDNDKNGDNNNINFEVDTAHYVLGNPAMTSRINRVILKYISKCPLEILHSKNREAYELIDTLPASNTITTEKLITGADTQGWSHSIQIKSANVGPINLLTQVDLNDLSINNTYTGVDSRTYIIEIDTTGATDTFKWSNDNGQSYTTGVSITGSAQSLEDGLQITFDNTTGHSVGDAWTFQAGPTDVSIEAFAFEYEEQNTLGIPNL